MGSLIKRRHPFSSLMSDFENELMRRWDQETPLESGDWIPAIDIEEKAKEFVVHADIPGVDPKNIDIHVENNILSLKGERESEKKEEKEGYVRIERAKGSFYRHFYLPETVDPDTIKATCDQGVLTVRIPKSSKKTSHKIQINS